MYHVQVLYGQLAIDWCAGCKGQEAHKYHSAAHPRSSVWARIRKLMVHVWETYECEHSTTFSPLVRLNSSILAFRRVK